MADAVGSDYWCVYNDCSQDVPLSVWSDPWQSSVASCDPVLITSLFDEIDEQVQSIQDDAVATKLAMANPQLPDELLNQDLAADISDIEYGAELLQSASTAVLSLTADDVSFELQDRCSEDDCQPAESVNEASVDNNSSVVMSPANSVLEVETIANGDADDSCSDVSQHSFLTYTGNDNDKNNSKELLEVRDCSEVSGVFVGGMQMLPKRLTARRIETVIDSFSDDGDDTPTASYNRRISPSRQRKVVGRDSEVTSTHRSGCSEVNKNALNARLNRQKKKAYIASLEAHQLQLSNENAHLKSTVTSLLSERDRLADEVDYLKAVLANDSALANLISGIKDTCGVHLTSQSKVTSRKRLQSVEADHDYTPSSKVRKNASRHYGGVCLHVQQSRLSLEFCDKCARLSNNV